MTSVAADEVAIPRRPAIDGLRFRRFRGPVDFPGMVAVNMAARRAYGDVETLTVEVMASDYRDLTNSDLATDLVVVEVGDQIAGYVRVEWLDQQDGSRAYGSICVLDPALRGRGIGGAMLAWAEDRLVEIAAAHPADRPRFFQGWIWSADAYGHRLLAGNGYRAASRAYEMVRPTLDDLPDPPLPDGLEIRPVGREHLRALWEADCEIFRDHPGERDESEAAWRRFENNPLTNPELAVVAFDGDDIAGMVLNVIDPADLERSGTARGLLDSVGVRRAWRRRGVARALIARSLRVLRDRGMTSAYLGVHEDNPNQAMTLHTDLGFEIVSGETEYRKPLAAPRRSAR